MQPRYQHLLILTYIAVLAHNIQSGCKTLVLLPLLSEPQSEGQQHLVLIHDQKQQQNEQQEITIFLYYFIQFHN